MNSSESLVPLEKLLRTVILLVILAVFMFPIVWILLTSIKSPVNQLASPPMWIPESPTMENYINLFQKGDFLKSLMNSFIVASFSTVLTVLAGSLAAYSFERFDATFLPNLYLTTRMIPPVVMIIPTYLGAYLLGILDTYFLLIFLYSALNMALIAWLLRDFFSKIPRELEEAAMIDGCTRLQSLRKVILPLVRPGLIASGLICFIFTWNEFIFALTLTGDRTRTLPVLVSTFITQRGMDRGLMAAASIIASIPIILVTMFFSRHLISGLTKGSTK